MITKKWQPPARRACLWARAKSGMPCSRLATEKLIQTNPTRTTWNDLRTKLQQLISGEWVKPITGMTEKKDSMCHMVHMYPKGNRSISFIKKSFWNLSGEGLAQPTFGSKLLWRLEDALLQPIPGDWRQRQQRCAGHLCQCAAHLWCGDWQSFEQTDP